MNPLSWRAAAICGLLWGIGVTLADTLTQPIGSLTPGQWLYFTLGLLWQWTIVGLVWAVGAKLLAHGRWAFAKLVALLPLALVVAVAAQWLSPFPKGEGLDAINTPLEGRIPIFDITMYLAWMNAFYGALYIAGYLATLRTARAGRQLTQYRFARNHADVLIREARVSAFRGQLQPSLLLAAIAALRDRYVYDPNSGELLFDSLIGFLRVAMPSIRSGLSTLGAELETVQNYASLRTMLPISGPRWCLDLTQKRPALPFPSLVLLPAMHGLGSVLGEQDVLTLSVTVAPDAVILRLEANRAVQLPLEIEHRLRGGLRLTFGPAAHISKGRDLPLTIRLSRQIPAHNPVYLDRTLAGDTHETEEKNGDRSVAGMLARAGQ